jgi:hypothetical protein
MEHRPDRYNFSLNLTKLNEIFANGVVDDSLINEFFSNNNFLLTDNTNNDNNEDVASSIQSDQKSSSSSSSSSKNNNAEIDFNHIIIFNIGNNDSYENPSHSYKLKFDQDKINYCNFDPKYLSNKRKAKSINKLDNQQVKKPDFNLNIFLKGQNFNESSQITGILIALYLNFFLFVYI